MPPSVKGKAAVIQMPNRLQMRQRSGSSEGIHWPVVRRFFQALAEGREDGELGEAHSVRMRLGERGDEGGLGDEQPRNRREIRCTREVWEFRGGLCCWDRDGIGHGTVPRRGLPQPCWGPASLCRSLFYERRHSSRGEPPQEDSYANDERISYMQIRASIRG